MLEDEIASLPTEEERRREVILTTILTILDCKAFLATLQGGRLEGRCECL